MLAGRNYAVGGKQRLLGGQTLRAIGLSVGMVAALVSGGLAAAAPGEGQGQRSQRNRSCDPCPYVTLDALNLREGPALNEDVVLVMPEGAEVLASNTATNGFREVEYRGRVGWAHEDYLRGAGAPVGIGEAFVASALNLREAPSFDANVLDVMPEGAVVEMYDQVVDGFRYIAYDGLSGWAFDAYLAIGEATTTDSLNLRADASLNGDILAVMPAGATLAVTGNPSNGFFPVVYEGMAGFASGDYLDQ
jgi:uncharacterized protein YraI